MWEKLDGFRVATDHFNKIMAIPLAIDLFERIGGHTEESDGNQ